MVSGRVPDLDSSEILPVIDKLDKALDKVRAEHPGFEIAVTGLSAIAARNSANMIESSTAASPSNSFSSPSSSVSPSAHGW